MSHSNETIILSFFLQSKLRSRLLSVEYQANRKVIIALQARARGYLSRTKGPLGRIYAIVRQKKIDEAEFRRLKKKNALEEAEELKRKRLADAATQNHEKQQPRFDQEEHEDENVSFVCTFLK